MRHLLNYWVTAGLAGLLLVLPVCDDNGVGPRPGDKEYLFYFYSASDRTGGVIDSTPRFISYNPYSNVVDTFLLPIRPRGDMGISPDGRRLYVPTLSAVAVIDLMRKQIQTELPYAGVVGVTASHHGSLLALYGPELWIVDARDYSVIYHDSVEVLRGLFSDDGSRFYYARGADGACVVALGDSMEPTCRQFPTDIYYLYVTQVEGVEGVAGGAGWLMYSLYAGDLWFLWTYDPVGDTALHVEQVPPGGGEFAITPDGQLVFCTSPGGEIGDWGEPPEISVFDMQTLARVAGISGLRYVDSTLIDVIYADDLSVTPDGKWLVAVPRYGGNTLILVNIETLTIERYIDLGGYPFLYSVVCQGKR